MILDKQTALSDAQALTVTADSTNYYDCGGDFDIGPGEPLVMMITVGVAADMTTGNETYAFAVETDDNTSFSSGTVLVSRTIAGADLTAGSVHVIPIPEGNERYLQAQYTLGGTTPTVTVDAHIVPQSFAATIPHKYYASGFTV